MPTRATSAISTDPRVVLELSVLSAYNRPTVDGWALRKLADLERDAIGSTYLLREAGAFEPERAAYFAHSGRLTVGGLCAEAHALVAESQWARFDYRTRLAQDPAAPFCADSLMGTSETKLCEELVALMLRVHGAVSLIWGGVDRVPLHTATAYQRVLRHHHELRARFGA